MKGQAVPAKLGEFVDCIDGGEHRAGRLPEHVTCLPADRPQTEAELVLFGGLRCHESPPRWLARLRRAQRAFLTTAGVSIARSPL
jgi:hypothetical protein